MKALFFAALFATTVLANRQPAVLTASAELDDAAQCLIPLIEPSPTPNSCGKVCKRVKMYIGEDKSLPRAAPKVVPQ